MKNFSYSKFYSCISNKSYNIYIYIYIVSRNDTFTSIYIIFLLFERPHCDSSSKTQTVKSNSAV